jgi:hypothetical protein
MQKKFLRTLAAWLLVLVTIVGSMNFTAVTASAASSNPNSKKGIQGVDFLDVDSYESLGVNHVLINIDLAHCISRNGGQYAQAINGVMYGFTESVTTYEERISELNRQGVTVTAVLLMSWVDDPYLQQLIYPSAREAGHTFYALNSSDAQAAAVLSSFYDYLIRKYSTSSCHIDNWVIGNEVNMPNAYNYTGTVDLNTNATIAADSFLLFYNKLMEINPNGKVYVSLDHSWTHNDEGRGIAGKDFLNTFNAVMNAKQPTAQWNIAYHAYPAIMNSLAGSDTVLWFNRYTTLNENTDFISGANVQVLTTYVKEHFGSNHRIILSEQGFDSRASEEQQAAAIAYTYYAAQNNDMIDAVIFRSLSDDVNDAPFELGLLRGSMQAFNAAKDHNGNVLNYVHANQKQSYDVFRYMDTAEASTHVDYLLSYIGVSSWTDLIANGTYGVSSSGASSTPTYKTVYAGRDWAAVYDKNYYLANNPDIAAAIGDNEDALLAHFVKNGMKEGRQASANFNVQTYRENYPDLAGAFGDQLWRYYYHYVDSGFAEGRNASRNTNAATAGVVGTTTASTGTTTAAATGAFNYVRDGVDYEPVFDPEYYAAHNPDVVAAVGGDQNLLLTHFILNGMREGRAGNDTFNVYSYMNSTANADLKAAFGDDIGIYYVHYCTSGKAEGRPIK